MLALLYRSHLCPSVLPTPLPFRPCQRLPSRPALPRPAPQKGQLGTGDLFQRNMPTVVEGLRGKKIVGGAAGRHHSVVYTSTGERYNEWGGVGAQRGVVVGPAGE